MLGGTEELELNMEPIRDFCERIDASYISKFDFLAYFKDMGMIDSVARVKDLSDIKMVRYDRLVEEYKIDRFEVNWEEVLRSNMDYDNIQTVGDYSTSKSLNKKVLMVSACLLRPGKHQYFIK